MRRLEAGSAGWTWVVAALAAFCVLAITTVALGADGEPTWLVMLYLNADDEILEEDMLMDLNEAEWVGSGENLTIVAQLDRYGGGFAGDGDWTSTRRYRVLQDADLSRLGSRIVGDLGEVNMGDGESLVDFITWAVRTFPADRRALILSDHGEGWPGGWQDDDPVPGDKLWLDEIASALDKARTVAAIDRLDLIGFDACLMGHIEVYAAVAPHARYVVSSQETEPTIGWAYAAFLEKLAADPKTNARDLARLIVETYIDRDLVLTDDRARVMTVLRGWSELTAAEAREVAAMEEEELQLLIDAAGVPDAPEFAKWLGRDETTLAAFDLSALPELTAALDDLVVAMSGIDPTTVAAARAYAQSFASVFGDDVPPSYVDLGHFARLVAETGGGAAAGAAVERLTQAIARGVIAEKHGSDRPGASGVSIYFPNSTLYGDPAGGIGAYTAVAGRFAEATLWDDFLGFHYEGRSIAAAGNVAATVSPAAPLREATIGPGASSIEMTPLRASAEAIAATESTVIHTEISGEQIGYIYLFVGMFDETSDSILIADMDYILADETRDLAGVFFPDWGEDRPLEIEFEWEPTLYALDDGTTSEFALFSPETYGAPDEGSTYSVEGIHTSAATGDARHAVAFFQGAEMTYLLGFTKEDGSGAPRRIQPRPGDTFTVLHEWLESSEDGETMATSVDEGTTFTFGRERFLWEAFDAFPGAYVVGLIAEDLDGNSYEEYIWIEVVSEDAVRYSDGFDVESDWAVETADWGRTAYLDGAYAMSLADANGWVVSWAPFEGRPPGGFTVNVDARKAFGADDGSYGIAWGTGVDDLYAFEVSTDGWYILGRRSGGVWEDPLIGWTVSPEVALGEEVNHLAVAFEGDVVTLMINGTAVESLTPPPIDALRFGLIVETWVFPEVDVLFDAFRLFSTGTAN